MARSQTTLRKKDLQNKREKKRKEKERKKQEKRDNPQKASFEDMIAYVDEYGMISSNPPVPGEKTPVDPENIEISTPTRDNSAEELERKGTVLYFNESKGYGFIKDSESKENVFVHVNNLLEQVNEGDVVSYVIAKGPKGYIATQVKIAGKLSSQE